jgi:hypothetical protein
LLGEAWKRFHETDRSDIREINALNHVIEDTPGA